MSKRALRIRPDSNDSRMPFEVHFREFESRPQNAGLTLEFSEIRSNSLEWKRREAPHA